MLRFFALPSDVALAPVRILFDTNVVIDAAVPERQYHSLVLELIGHVESGNITGLVAPTSIATCWYVATARYDVDPRPLFEALESMFELALMNRPALRSALAAGDGDFEDAYLAASGAEAEANVIVTRNESDFAGGPLPPQHPRDLVAVLREGKRQ